MSYKYCIVPKCTNTTVKTAEKLFFRLPSDEKMRRKWCQVMKRDDKNPLSTKSSLYCCEDHFDLEEDMASYIKYKLVGGKLTLKKGVMPHKFECQQTVTNRIERQDIEYFEGVLTKNVQRENLILEFHDCGEPEEQYAVEDRKEVFVPDNTEEVSDEKIQKKRAVQVYNTEFTKEKSTNTSHTWEAIRNKPFSYTKQPDHTMGTVSITAFSTSLKSTDAECEFSDTEIKVENENSIQSHMQTGDLMAKSWEPKLLIRSLF